MPSDISTLQTGLQVLKDYQLEWSLPIARGVGLFAVTIIIIFLYAPEYHSKEPAKKRLWLAVLGSFGMMIPLYAVNLQDASIVELDGWNSSVTYSKYGFALSFIGYMQSMRIEKPDSYTNQHAEDILEPYKSTQDIENTERPTIIAIMNESFGDLRDRGNLGATDNANQGLKIAK